MTQDISQLSDIQQLVDTFYGKVRQDALIGPIFDRVIEDRWSVHLDKMYTFWQTVLLKEHTYYGRPFPPHVRLPLEQHHFERWLTLFCETVDEYFTGEKAEEAKWRAQKMAEMFLHKIMYFRNQGGTPIS